MSRDSPASPPPGSDAVRYEMVVSLIHSSCIVLDSEKFEEFLSLCVPEFRYKITAYSPEIRKEMTWMDHDYEGMEALLKMVPQHLRRLGNLLRHVSVGPIVIGEQSVQVTSTFQVIHTDLHGRSDLFVAGRYFDEIVSVHSDRLALKSRRVHLDTRDLGIGSHVPI